MIPFTHGADSIFASTLTARPYNKTLTLTRPEKSRTKMMTGNMTRRQELREAKFEKPMRAIKKHDPNRAKVVEYSFEEEVEQFLDPHLTNPRRIREQEEKDKAQEEATFQRSSE